MIRYLYTYIFIPLFITIGLTIEADAQSRACQDIELYFDTLNCTPVPVSGTDGYLYFDLCPEDTLYLKVFGVYPDNGTHYIQHDTLNKYFWDFGDGTNQATEKIPTTEHQYSQIRGYDINITASDQNNCSSGPLAARVRLAGNPITEINTSGVYCQYDTVSISIKTIIETVPFTYELNASESYDSLTFLPDGVDCGFGDTYYTDVVFESFAPGATISSLSDILSVCVNMEHTYIGDFYMKLICPNGSNVLLKSEGGGGKHLGIANTNDNGADKCDPVTNPPGTGWNYCWSEFYPAFRILNNGNTTFNNSVDSTDIYGLDNFYIPEESFTNLIGCPLNGLWTIEIKDNLGIDNGYIWSWTLNLDPSLLPQDWFYSVGSDSCNIEGPGIISVENDSMLFAPQLSGIQDYTIYAVDSFGCSWDTTIQLYITPLPALVMPASVEFCSGQSVEIDGGECTACTYLWNTGQTGSKINVATPGIYWREVTSGEGCSSRDTTTAIMHTRPAPPVIYHD